MPEPIELERLGRPYFQCPSCDYGVSGQRDTVIAHMHDHEPRPTLDEVLAAQAVPTPEPAATTTSRKRKE